MKKCTSCGYQNPDEQNFCGNCGTKLDAMPAIPSAKSEQMETDDSKENCAAEKEQDSSLNPGSLPPVPPKTPAQESGTDSQWVCPQCKRMNDAQNQFCVYCGTKKTESSDLKETVQQTVTEQVDHQQMEASSTDEVVSPPPVAPVVNQQKQENQRNQTPNPVPNQKSGAAKKVLIGIAVAACLAVVGGGFYFMTQMQKEKEVIVETTPCSREFMVLAQTPVYAQMNGEEVETLYDKGERILITETAENQDGITWGHDKLGWIQIDDQNGQIEEIVLKSQDLPDSGKEFEAVVSAQTYAEPSSFSNQKFKINQGDKTSFSASMSDQFGTEWRQTKDLNWVIFKSDGDTFFKEVEKKEEKPAEEPKKEVKQDQISVPSQSNDKSSFQNTVVYKTEYIMKIREQPNLNGKQIGRAEEGQRVTIVETVLNSDGSLWGKIDTGGWICIYDKDTTYLHIQ